MGFVLNLYSPHCHNPMLYHSMFPHENCNFKFYGYPHFQTHPHGVRMGLSHLEQHYMAYGIPGKCFGASSTRPCSVAAVIVKPQMTCSSLNRPMKEVPLVDHGHAAKRARRSPTRTASSITLQFSPAMEHGSFPVPIQHPFRCSFRLSFRNWQQV